MTEPEPTVVLHINIRIDVNEDADTGVPLGEWNAMSDADRDEVVTAAWKEAAQADSGGTWVVTPGAKGV